MHLAHRLLLARGMIARALSVLLVAVLVAAPVTAEAGGRRYGAQQRAQKKQKGRADEARPRRPGGERLAKVLQRARRIPRAANRVRKMAFTGPVGKASLVLTALGAVGLQNGAAAANAILIFATAALVAGLNVTLRVSDARFAARHERFEREQEEMWARMDDDFRAFDEDMRGQARAGESSRPPPRAPEVTAALTYFGVAHLDAVAAKEEAKKIYRRKARELHPDVAIPRGVTKEAAEAAFGELARHYDVIQRL